MGVSRETICSRYVVDAQMKMGRRLLGASNTEAVQGDLGGGSWRKGGKK